LGDLTALSILAPASDAHASPVFCASLARPGSSPFTFAEAVDISAGGTVSYVADNFGLSKNTFKLLLSDLWVPTGSVQVVAHTSCSSKTQYEGQLGLWLRHCVDYVAGAFGGYGS